MSLLATAVLSANDVREVLSVSGYDVPWPYLTFILFVMFVVWWIGGLEVYKHRQEKSKPNLEFKQGKDWQFYRQDEAIYGALQIWFVNRPKIASDSSVAKDVTAKVTFYNRASKNEQDITACFIEAESFDWAGNIGRFEKIDQWAPNDEPRKLQVALRWPNEDSAYGFVYTSPPDGRIGEIEIPKGTYYVRVSFSGTRVNQPPLWFDLVNPGMGENNPFLSISTPIKKPNLRKEGFQTE